jgi:hypothetical protein
MVNNFTNTSITKADISLLHQVSEHKNAMTSLDGRACASFGQDKQYCSVKQYHIRYVPAVL